MPVPFTSRASVPDEVLVSELGGESVILNLKSESYFGLDEIGARMWAVVTSADSIQAGYDALKDEYDVDPEQLRFDLTVLIEKLVAEGLLQVRPPQ